MDIIDFTSAGGLWTVFCSIFFVIQLCYIGGVYMRVHKAAKKQNANAQTNDEQHEWPPLSVIVVTKDSGNMLSEYFFRI